MIKITIISILIMIAEYLVSIATAKITKEKAPIFVFYCLIMVELLVLFIANLISLVC